MKRFRHAIRVANSPFSVLLAVAGWFVFPLTSSKVLSEDPDDKTPASLAVCRLQTVTPTVRAATMDTPRRRRLATRALTDYQRGRGIDWRVPKNVDANDPGIRCLLMCPGGPYVLEVRVLIDGQPFRMKREQFIDQSRLALEKVPPDRDADEDSTENEAAKNRSDAVARLVRYMKRQEDSVDRNEARWLLAQWTPGPALLNLRHGFGSERANIAPLWALLDRDQDGILSQEELSAASERLADADANGDEDVEMTELRRFMLSSPKISDESGNTVSSSPIPGKLLITIDDDTNFESLYADISKFYAAGRTLAAGECDASGELIQRLDSNQNGIWDLDETVRLREISPDLTMQVQLGTSDEPEAGLSVQQLSSALGPAEQTLRASDELITVDLRRCMLELSAAQSGSALANQSLDQVAIGAVMDGYPVLRMLDRNHDRRLSRRECKAIRSVLESQDKNNDGQVMWIELRLPVRICVTLGPMVHQILREPSWPAALPFAEPEQPEAPPWFVTMDSNKDGDLSRKEFLGTRDQFKALDADNDGLLSVKEASRFDLEEE